MIYITKTGINMASYATLLEFKTYLSDRGIADTWTDEQETAALFSMTNDYIEIKYTFDGLPLVAEQGLQLPTDIVTINRRVVQATCEGAYLHLQSKLFNNELDKNGAIKVLATSDGLDVLKEAESIEYFSSGGQSYLVTHKQIDMLLAPYLANSRGLTFDYAL